MQTWFNIIFGTIIGSLCGAGLAICFWDIKLGLVIISIGVFIALCGYFSLNKKDSNELF